MVPLLPTSSSSLSRPLINSPQQHGKPPPLRVLVVYASLHGSTRSIAEFLGDRLRKEGFSVVDTMSVEEARQDRPISLYDAVVLGSAVHNRAWLPVMMDYVVDNEAEVCETTRVALLRECRGRYDVLLLRSGTCLGDTSPADVQKRRLAQEYALPARVPELCGRRTRLTMGFPRDLHRSLPVRECGRSQGLG